MMSTKTAQDVVRFIERSCGNSPIRIRWFGGEPTVAADRIDQISQGLCDCGVKYSSIVTTNGYLFNKKMVEKAKNLWNVTQVTISIDGTEKTTNRVKAFPGAKDNPYQRIMNNVALLLKASIPVAIRMNFDKDTWQEFADLINEVHERFHDNRYLMVYPHQINWDMPSDEWAEMEKWLNQKNDELRTLASQRGNYRRKERLPSLSFEMCEAGRNSNVTIRPDGTLVSCPEHIDDSQVKGNVLDGVVNEAVVLSWKRFADLDRCHACSLFPTCGMLVNCAGAGRCSDLVGRMKHIEENIIAQYKVMESEGGYHR